MLGGIVNQEVGFDVFCLVLRCARSGDVTTFILYPTGYNLFCIKFSYYNGCCLVLLAKSFGKKIKTRASVWNI